MKSSRKRIARESRQAVLPNSVYQTKTVCKGIGTLQQSGRARFKHETKESAARLKERARMLQIESYAKEHGITITQAMIHFM